jgi:hypothetical protein
VPYLRAFALFGLSLLLGAGARAQLPDPCPDARPVPPQLTLPTRLPPGQPLAFEQQLRDYLSSYAYRQLGWCVDKGVRDTGPFIGGKSYGTHAVVRVYYSPQAMQWLRAGRQGPIADGAVIIKEQYGDAAPAENYAGLDDAQLRPTDWTIMIRKAGASRDGWFWGEVWTPAPTDTSPTQYPAAGFDLYCLRCHASAERQSTFSSLRNIRGFEGSPLGYRVDDSWRVPRALPAAAPPGAQHGVGKLAVARQPVVTRALPTADPVRSALLRFAPPPAAAVQRFPPEPLDHQGSRPDSVPPFLTSDNCLGCHSAASGPPAGPSMWLSQGRGVDVSPYGEWRWSPMGLAGRDPIFHAQLEGELATLPKGVPPQQVIDTCMLCHGAMGKRSHAAEHPGQPFSLGFLFETDPAAPGFRYGGLARDGVSCSVCHHVADDGLSLNDFLATRSNGRFAVNRADQLQGPFKDDEIAPDAMANALGAKPVHAPFVRSSRLCGSCHTIELPVLDGRPGQTSIEQNTYVEWLNSRYQNEIGTPGPNARTCQDCHMKSGYRNDAQGIDVAQIRSRIALIQDRTYPAAEGTLPPERIDVRFRDSGYRRHDLLGLNAFLLQMFSQFSDVLGVRTDDYMSGSDHNLATAIGNIVQQAQHETARVAVTAEVTGNTLSADVTVSNLVGHRFPSGVGFRRAFLEFKVVDTRAADRVLFASGRTDANGVIVGADGQPLATEFFGEVAGRQQYQPHFDQQHPITSEQQVQIYEELVQDAQGRFTTSFVRRDTVLKDNRLLPMGWTPTGPAPDITPKFIEATHPHGTNGDPSYQDGQGTSRLRYRIALPPGTDARQLRVEVTLYHQSIPPYYLRDRFQQADGPATQRLAWITSRLNLAAGSGLENWKLRIASAQALPK